MDPKEFENMIKEADQSREKSLVLLICCEKSLSGLKSEITSGQLNDEHHDQMNQLLDCVDNVINLWLTKLANSEIKEEELSELILESGLLEVLGHYHYMELTTGFVKVEQILDKLFTSLPLAAKSLTCFYLFLMSNAQKFRQETGKEKFTLSGKLNGYLSRNLKFCLDSLQVQQSIGIIAETIYNILQNKLTEQLRLPIFALLSTITLTYDDLDWFIKEGDERRSFLLVSRLACIESRMCLEAKLDDLNLLTSSLVILEYSIKILIETEESTAKAKSQRLWKSKPKILMNNLTNEDIIQLIDSIKLLMESILIYLKDNQTSLTDNSKEADPQFIACLRVLCLYLTFENKFLNDKFEDIINLIVKFILNELSKSSDQQLNLINLCLTTLISITDDDPQKYKDQLVKSGLIGELESQVKSCKQTDEINMFKSFLDSII